jgi:23S rRNA pseudouridine2605 synthase
LLSTKSGNEAKKKAPKLNKKRNKHLLRADRVLANRGWGSRSECTELLKRRRVFVESENGERVVVKGPSEKLTMDATLFVDSTPVPTIPLLLAYHKPKWVLSVLHDPQGRPNLGTLLSEVQQRQKLHPVGRLDYDTSGLLLFSTNGSLTQRLLHPTHEVEKEYVALVDGTVDSEALQKDLERGVETTEGVHTAELLEVTHVDSEQVSELLKQMRSKLPREYNVTDLEVRGYLFNETTSLSKVRLKVSEGKHRMVRRMLANCGHGVVELKRERHGQVTLGDLPEGEFRELTTGEQEWAEGLVSKQKGKERRQL